MICSKHYQSLPNVKKYILFIVTLCLLLTSCSKLSEVRIQKQLDLGNKYLTEMNYEKAVIAFSKVIELDEKNVAAYEGLGEANQQLGNTEDAIAAFETAVELDPANIQACLSLSELYGSSGDDAKAEEYCNRILEIDPDNKEAKDKLIILSKGQAKELEEEEKREKQRNQKSEDELKKILEQKFNLEKYGWAIADYNGDGAEDLFASQGYLETGMTVYYVDSQGEKCQKVGEMTFTDLPGYAAGHLQVVEIDGVSYFVYTYGPGHSNGIIPIIDTIIEYYVFGVRDEEPQMITKGGEISLDDLEAGKIAIN